MPKTLVLMIGIQGSGKSTFYRKYLQSEYVHINLDTLKTRKKEADAIDECFKNGQSFAVDNTNPSKRDRQRYIPSAKFNGYRIIGYFMESKIKDCIERNNKRIGIACVPEEAIAATSNKLEMPSYDEGFDELYFVKIVGEEMVIDEWRDTNEV